MVTQQDLLQHIGRVPFVPFRITLKSGETIDVVRRFRAVAMPRQMVVATEEERLRWILLEQINRVDAYQLPHGASN